MDKKELVIAGIIIIVAIVVASIILAPQDNAKDTSISILNKGEFGANATLYVKLTDNENSLSNKEVHIKLTDSNGKSVYDKTVKTHATGVAIAKLDNINAGNYTLNITFDGDENYTASSISKKITIQGEEIEEQVENATLIEDTLADANDFDNSYDSSNTYSQSNYYSQSSSQSSSSQSSSSQSSSSDPDYYDGYTDSNGDKMLKEYDEDGNLLDPGTL